MLIKTYRKMLNLNAFFPPDIRTFQLSEIRLGSGFNFGHTVGTYRYTVKWTMHDKWKGELNPNFRYGWGSITANSFVRTGNILHVQKVIPILQFCKAGSESAFRKTPGSAKNECGSKALGSVVEPKPAFFAGAGAGEKEPAPACYYVI